MRVDHTSPQLKLVSPPSHKWDGGKQATQRTQMQQHEGNKGDAYPYSLLLPVPGMHRMITTEGVPLLPSLFLQLTNISKIAIEKCKLN